MPTKTDEHLRRWSTDGVVKLDKELAHLRRAAPNSASIPRLALHLDARRADAPRLYDGNQIGT